MLLDFIDLSSCLWYNKTNCNKELLYEIRVL